MYFTWRVSDCEELVGAITGDDVGGHAVKKTLINKAGAPDRF